MNVDGIANINGHGHGGVAQCKRPALGVADFGPAAVGFCVPVGDLYEQERKIPFVPSATPVANHRREQVRIKGSSRSRVGFALIPDDSLDWEWRERRDHPVEESGGGPRGEFGMPFSPRDRLALSLGLLDRFLIFAFFLD